MENERRCALMGNEITHRSNAVQRFGKRIDNNNNNINASVSFPMKIAGDLCQRAPAQLSPPLAKLY